jgi:hypothetical protein
VSHLLPEIQLHPVAAIPNGLTVEYMPWTLRLFEETPAIVRGQLVVPTKPGLGLVFDQAAIKRYRSAEREEQLGRLLDGDFSRASSILTRFGRLTPDRVAVARPAPTRKTASNGRGARVRLRDRRTVMGMARGVVMGRG